MSHFRKPTLWILAFSLAVLSTGCAHSNVFKNEPPIHHANDTLASPIPDKTDFNFVEYSVTSSVRYPLVDLLDTKRKPRSQDVNSYDQIPKSSWYTPRLGFENISPQELVKGPEDKGEPQLPVKVLKVKNKGNSPGFIIEDARGLKYLIKFDISEYPALQSTSNFVVNRLFWGFGYFVPEDTTFYFPSDSKDYSYAEGITQDEVDRVLMFVHMEEDGRYRSVASLFLEGEILGPIAQKGTRKNDLNDTIDHENRRTLRALKMFCAWVNNTGMRSDNSLDVYIGKAGQGHTRHYILDFGETFGVHGIEKGRTWDGFERFFSFHDMTRNFFNLGFPLKNWEKLKESDVDFLGSFESEIFDPKKWKSSVQFMPMIASQPDDDYWAAKVIAGVTPSHLQALLQAANHPDQEYLAAIETILLKRREKILEYAFSRVSPIEFVSLAGDNLILSDFSKKYFNHSAQYEILFLNSKGKEITDSQLIDDLTIPLHDAISKSNGYLVVDVRVINQDIKAPRSAKFHIQTSGGKAQLIGVTH